MLVPEPNKDTSDMKMYVLVNRSKLSLVQSGVQSCHATHSYCLKYKDNKNLIEWNDKHKTLILLEAKQNEITELMDYCNKNGKTYHEFYEPDLGGLLTACCFEPMDSVSGSLMFNRFKLLK